MEWADIDYPSEGTGRDRALWWVGMVGAPVFPAGVIHKGQGSWTKQPFLAGWQKLENCARTVSDVVDLWNSRPGWFRADCGVLLNNFVLVDLDTKDGIYNGKDQFKKIVADLGLDLNEVIKGAIVYETPGRSGGVHILWLRPDNARGHSKSVPADGIEVLGNAHYMLSPCSKRPDRAGFSYRLIHAPEKLRLTTPPGILWEAIKRNGGSVNGGGTSGVEGRSDKPSLEQALALSDNGMVSPGLRHDVLFKEAARRAAAGGDESEVKEWIWDILRADPPVMELPDGCGEEEVSRWASNAVRWAAGLEDKDRYENVVFDVEIIRQTVEFVRSTVRGRKWQSTSSAL